MAIQNPSLWLSFIVIIVSSCEVKESINNKEVEQQVTSSLHKIFDACKQKNFTALESYHINTSRFSIFKEDGSRERLDARKNNEIIKKELNALDDVEFGISDLKIDVISHAAVATFILSINASIQGTKITGSNRATFVFVEDDGSWKVMHEHFSPVTRQ
jgi:hypothetical protein